MEGMKRGTSGFSQSTEYKKCENNMTKVERDEEKIGRNLNAFARQQFDMAGQHIWSWWRLRWAHEVACITTLFACSSCTLIVWPVPSPANFLSSVQGVCSLWIPTTCCAPHLWASDAFLLIIVLAWHFLPRPSPFFILLKGGDDSRQLQRDLKY